MVKKWNTHQKENEGFNTNKTNRLIQTHFREKRGIENIQQLMTPFMLAQRRFCMLTIGLIQTKNQRSSSEVKNN